MENNNDDDDDVDCNIDDLAQSCVHAQRWVIASEKIEISTDALVLCCSRLEKAFSLRER